MFLKTGEIVENKQIHEFDSAITDLQMSPDRLSFITASKDKSAKVRIIGTKMTTSANEVAAYLLP